MNSLRVVPWLLLTSCLQIGTGNNGDAGSSSPSAMTPTVADAGTDAPLGTGCAIDNVSGITLCTSIAACPGLVVDHDLYPDCGFRVPTNSIDLECVCDDFLCPVGAALTCAQAKSLLEAHSALAVCVSQNEGRCAARSLNPTKTTGSCDKSCASECGGAPGCLTLCGC